MTALIRRIEARDEARWRKLWDGYCAFYEREPAPKINDYTWKRIMDSASPVYGIVAERATYWSAGGQFWAAGASTLLTRLP